MDSVRALLIVLTMIGGMLIPGGDRLLAAPAAIISVPLVLIHIYRSLPRIHWGVVFVAFVFPLLLLPTLYSETTTEYGNGKILSFITITAFCALMSCLVKNSNTFIRIAWFWLSAATVIAVYSLATGSGARLTGIDTNPIWLARMLSVALIFAAWLIFTRRLRVVPGIVFCLILAVAIFGTGSRGPLLGALAGLATILMFTSLTPARKFGIVTLGVIGSLLFLQLPSVQSSRIVGLATGEIPNDPSRGRLLTEAFRLIGEHPSGVGIGNWSTHANLINPFDYPHNIFIEILVEQGVLVGAVFFLVVLGVAFSIIRKARFSSLDLGIAAWLLAEMVFVAFSGDLNARTFFFALTLSFVRSMETSPSNHREAGTLGQAHIEN